MKHISFFSVAVCFCTIQLAEAQTVEPSGSNPLGVNYTFVPTSNGDWIVAVPRNEQLDDGTFTNRKNTIALFRVDKPDDAVSLETAEEITVIGLRDLPFTDSVFYKDAEFEVHCIARYANAEVYFLCGSVSMSANMPPMGMVAILDEKLNLLSLRRYPDAKVFYSVYAKDDYYYVCGRAKEPFSYTMFVLRDSISIPEIPQNIKAFLGDENLCTEKWTVDPIEFEAIIANPSTKRFYIGGMELFPSLTKRCSFYKRDNEEK